MAASVSGPVRRVVRFGVFEVDFGAGEVRRHGRRLRVQEKPFQLLQALLERPGDLVTRDELRARLWPADTFVDFDNGLNNAVNKVRRALGDAAALPAYVETVGRRGYRFIGAIDADVHTPAPPVSGWVPLSAATIRSLAVLPLADLSHDSEEYFSDGMTDALISQIAGIRSLRVISRQSIVRYKGSRAPMPRIARELGVDGIIEGTVLRSGGRVRVNVQLVHGAADRHLWSGRWEREMSDVLVVQAEIARAVAQAMAATVTGDEATRLSRAGNIDPTAYDEYLKGRYFVRQRTRDGLLRSVEYYRKAVGVAPSFALAHAALAESFGPLGYLGYLPPHEATPAMRAAAMKALELDPDLVEGLTAMAACLAFHEWRWRDGEAHFLRALAINPNHSLAYFWYGLLLEIEGRHEESLAARERGLVLDPLWLRARVEVSWGRFMCGHAPAADMELRSLLELDPAFYFTRRCLGIIAVREGRYDDAIAAFDVIREREPGSLAHALALAGRIDESRDVGRALELRSQQEYVSPVQYALAHLGLGHVRETLAELERGLTLRTIDLAAVRTDPRFSGLRPEPRFQRLVRAMNLEPCTSEQV